MPDVPLQLLKTALAEILDPAQIGDGGVSVRLFSPGGDLTVTVWAAVVKVPQLLMILSVML